MRTAAVLCVFFLFGTPAVDARPTPLAGALFVVDPGHGTNRPDGTALNVGAVSRSGIRETTVTLAVGERLAALLRADGARVVLTRSFAHPYRVGTNLHRDNRARAALANRLHATAFISVHCDASLDVRSHGTSVFWWRPNSAAFARNMRRSLAPHGLAESQYRPRNLAVTDEARVPALLVELGFITDPAQAGRLTDSHFEEREARALESAIITTFGRVTE